MCSLLAFIKKTNIGNYGDIITQLWQGNEYTTTKTHTLIYKKLITKMTEKCGRFYYLSN
jgi:hypothetical protein